VSSASHIARCTRPCTHDSPYQLSEPFGKSTWQLSVPFGKSTWHLSLPCATCLDVFLPNSRACFLIVQHVCMCCGSARVRFKLVRCAFPCCCRRGARAHCSSRGFRVDLNVGKSAADATVFMAKSSTFIKTHGGLSDTIASVVAQNGGEVLHLNIPRG
jgi:hypothetical protein